ncbi:MAG: repair protein NreA [Methanoculleus sp.]|nr:repair protein NreA [Methanoculleus sp.]MDK2989216.1 repair protein NreA [Methanoculleus sp.]
MRCAECKGKGLCGLERCPIMSRFYAQIPVRPSDRYQGAAPSVFVGSYGYPKVAGGPLMIDDADHPPDWIARGLAIDDIVGLRARTIRGAGEAKGLSGNIQEIALSNKPLDVEVRFVKPVAFDLRFDGTIAPVGLTGAIKKMDVLENARVDRAVDRATSDTDLSATDACELLNASGTDVYRITQLLTAGLLGNEKKRRVVPTRWAITAVDDTVSKQLKKKIARYPPLSGIEIFSASLYGNHIVCILVPGDWKFEMIEVWGKQSLWGDGSETIARDGEGLTKSGYSPLAGAYYSARLAVAEYLESVRRSARVLVLRNVTGEYWAPLGTWVVREATRNAMRGGKTPCTDLRQAIDLASRLIGFDRWRPYSQLIPELATQKTLFDF